jgi:hypothetical protein
MGEYKLTREEMETHVWGNAASDEWEIYTADPKDIRRMDKLGYPVVERDEFGARYRVPRRAIRFGRLEKRKPTGAALTRNADKLQNPSLEREISDQPVM